MRNGWPFRAVLTSGRAYERGKSLARTRRHRDHTGLGRVRVFPTLHRFALVSVRPFRPLKVRGDLEPSFRMQHWASEYVPTARDRLVVPGLGRLGGCRLDNVSCQSCGQFNDFLDPETFALRPVVEHGDAARDPDLAVRDPRHVDIEVLNAGGHSPVGRVARPSDEDLVLIVVEQPDLGVVVRLWCRYSNSKPERPCGDHPCKAVQCVTGERRRIGSSLDEHVGDQLGCFLRRHLGALLDGGSFVREQCRGDREVDWSCFLTVEVYGESRRQPFYPAGREPSEGATHAPRCAESRNEDLLSHGLFRQLEQFRLEAALVSEHV